MNNLKYITLKDRLRLFFKKINVITFFENDYDITYEYKIDKNGNMYILNEYYMKNN